MFAGECSQQGAERTGNLYAVGHDIEMVALFRRNQEIEVTELVHRVREK
ncbi:MAG TPA: hypothetical protein VK540_22990 [Polyangiaceae bacterium]|nr:hypothetical protein [Polyangiaceae bacterium]